MSLVLAIDLGMVHTTRLFHLRAHLPCSTFACISCFLLQLRATSPAVHKALAEIMDEYGDRYTEPVGAAALSQVAKRKRNEDRYIVSLRFESKIK